MSAHGNPYRQPKPAPHEVIASGKFYQANDRGSYGAGTTPVYLTLCRDYLWVSKVLSIPLAAITDTGLSKHGGYICFVDAVTHTELRFNFTNIGFLRFKRKGVESFLALLNDHLSLRDASIKKDTTAELLANVSHCEKCELTDVHAFVFKTLQFVGIAPIAYSYKLTPLRYILCAKHARQQVFKHCLHTACVGYLGFPGFIAAPWYIITNLWGLWKGGAANVWTIAVCVLATILFPLAALTMAILFLSHLKLT